MSKRKARRARPAGTGGPTNRSAETATLRKRWEHNRAVHARERYAQLETYVASKCDGYRYLFTIYAKTCNETLAEAIHVLQVLKLDGPDWRRRLDEITRFERGGGDNDFALSEMRHHIERQKWSTIRAAEHAVAQFGLYLDSNSFPAAVQRAREVWRSYTKGVFRPLGDLMNPDGIVVRPNTDNLKKDEVRRILDPRDQQPLPLEGKRVPDTPFWRNMIALGLVAIVDGGL